MQIIKDGDKTVFFAEGNMPSLKNGKVKTKWGLIPSKTVRRYMKERSDQWFDEEFKKEFLSQIENKEFPIKLHLYFIRDSRRRADYVNLAQLPLDLLVKANLLPDDNMDYLCPVFDGYHIDKQNAGIKFYIE
jgi:hypothetical protein